MGISMIIIFNRMLFLLLCFAGYVSGAEKRGAKRNREQFETKSELPYANDIAAKQMVQLPKGEIAVEGEITHVASSFLGNIVALIRKSDSCPVIDIYKMGKDTYNRIFEQVLEEVEDVKKMECSAKQVVIIGSKKVEPKADAQSIIITFSKDGKDTEWTKKGRSNYCEVVGLSMKNSLAAMSHEFFLSSHKATYSFVEDNTGPIPNPIAKNLLLGSGVTPNSWIEFANGYYVVCPSHQGQETETEKRLWVYKYGNLTKDQVTEMQEFDEKWISLKQEISRINQMRNNWIHPVFSLEDIQKMGAQYLPLPQLSRNNVAIHLTKPLIVYPRPDKNLIVVNFEKKCAKAIVPICFDIKAVVWHPTREMVAFGDQDGKIYRADFEQTDLEKRKVKNVPVHQGSVNALAFSENGKWLFSGGSDGKLCYSSAIINFEQ